MGLAEEIKQTHFKNNYQKAGINLIYTSTWFSEQIKLFLSKEDLTSQQFNVLRILRGSLPQPLSTLQIRERMLDKMSDTSRIVDRLVKKGLVCKGTCKEDKRLVDVTIVDEGLAVLKVIDAKEHEMYDFMNNISPEEAEILSTILDKIRKDSSEH